MELNYSPGLDGIIAAETKLSFLDTVGSQIVIRGYDLIELSQRYSYLDIVYLLLHGEIPTTEQQADLQDKLKAHYQVPQELFQIFKLLPNETHAMDGLRTGISVLAGFDQHINDRSTEMNLSRAYRLLGGMPNIVANSYRVLNGQEAVEPDSQLSYSANFYYMITGRKPTALEEEIFDQSLVLYSEHEMPNSTFAARVIASTQSDLYGALTGAVASLKGNLHGGANEAVMYMLLEAKTVEGFEALLKNKLQNKEKIMGFGHRVYMKKMDPRAQIMKEALHKLCLEQGDDRLYHMCEAGEKVMVQEKGLYPNLDYYAAPVYYMLGLPIEIYTPIFFGSRTIGLCAHVIEQHDNNRLFRPRVNYIGERHNLEELSV
ncbi:citrate synthase [Lysinibacillus sp. FSL K6-4013]|uniref:citrate synthase n=1 Tax=Lysinibacillus sp. FSL K6-4013 TaxID=2921504 RepID=UPI00315B3915